MSIQCFVLQLHFVCSFKLWSSMSTCLPLLITSFLNFFLAIPVQNESCWLKQLNWMITVRNIIWLSRVVGLLKICIQSKHVSAMHHKVLLCYDWLKKWEACEWPYSQGDCHIKCGQNHCDINLSYISLSLHILDSVYEFFSAYAIVLMALLSANTSAFSRRLVHWQLS